MKAVRTVNNLLQIRCTPEERAAWDKAAGNKTTSALARWLLNKHAGYERPLPIAKMKAPPPPRTHCSYSGLPKNQCLCGRCNR